MLNRKRKERENINMNKCDYNEIFEFISTYNNPPLDAAIELGVKYSLFEPGKRTVCIN